jgi:putative intracellular protease/amidase
MSRKIAYLYTFEGLADWEIGYLTAELASRRYLNGPAEAPELRTFGTVRGEIMTMGGLRVTSDLSLDEIRAEDAALLILPGGDSWTRDSGHEGVAELAAAFLEAGIPVAAICGSTFALARAGLLNARRHTSNDLGYLKAVAPGYRGERLYRQEGAVADGKLITASGLASLDFARETLRTLGVMRKETLDAWYELNKTPSGDHYFTLEASLK